MFERRGSSGAERDDPRNGAQDVGLDVSQDLLLLRGSANDHASPEDLQEGGNPLGSCVWRRSLLQLSPTSPAHCALTCRVRQMNTKNSDLGREVWGRWWWWCVVMAGERERRGTLVGCAASVNVAAYAPLDNPMVPKSLSLDLPLLFQKSARCWPSTGLLRLATTPLRRHLPGSCRCGQHHCGGPIGAAPPV